MPTVAPARTFTGQDTFEVTTDKTRSHFLIQSLLPRLSTFRSSHLRCCAQTVAPVALYPYTFRLDHTLPEHDFSQAQRLVSLDHATTEETTCRR